MVSSLDLKGSKVILFLCCMRYNATIVISLDMLQLTDGTEHINQINRHCSNINNQGDCSTCIIMILMVIVTHVTCLAIRHMIADITNGGEVHFMQGLYLA